MYDVIKTTSFSTIMCVLLAAQTQRVMLEPHAGRRSSNDGGPRTGLKEDKKHMTEHHHDETYLNETDISDGEMALYYFKLHDLNNDTRLDGLEIFKALEHSDMPEVGDNSSKRLTPAQTDAAFAAEEDLNNDGFIELAEFMRMQQHTASASAS